MRRILCLLFLYSACRANGFVLINEIYYDHPGEDSGHEWVELYNISNISIDLKGWKLETGGNVFEPVYEFGMRNIGAHEYILIGEEAVINADIIVDLNLQNGGTATDGVRITAPEGIWTDTILYDKPNTNNLLDDLGNVGNSFAPVAEPGKSLGRFPNGLDTNDGTDWQERRIPSPGNNNKPEIDLFAEAMTIIELSGNFQLELEVFNLSTEGVDNSAGSLDIYLNDLPWNSEQLPGIEGKSGMEFSFSLPELEECYHKTEIQLNSIYDYNISNNALGCSILLGSTPLIINELMVCPLANNEEWVEIYLSGNVDNLVDNLLLIDGSGVGYEFQISGLESGYYILGNNAELLSGQYGINPEQLIITDGFPGLNNSGDIVMVEDCWGTVLDIITYENEAGSEPGRSYERRNPYDPDSEWGICDSETGHTAGKENSIIYGSVDMKLRILDVSASQGQITHEFLIKNNGLSEVEEAEIHLYWEELSGNRNGHYREEITISDQEESISFFTEEQRNGYYRFEYFLKVAGDVNNEDNYGEWYLNFSSLAWVINEIMYHPVSDEPEWLEIKSNLYHPAGVELIIVVDKDSTIFECPGEYVVISGNKEDTSVLQALYGEDILIYEGLGRLLDSGSDLLLIDKYGNRFEQFCYKSNWNHDLRGISIERINPCLNAQSDNWGRSISGCTPGRENSIYQQVIPATSEFSITPEIFSPREGESVYIAYKDSSSLNKVNIKVYDLKGRIVRHLADQELQGMEKSYIWDGRNDYGEYLITGIYIVLFEGTGGGRTYKKKATVTVAW